MTDVLASFAQGLATGEITVVDLTQTLSEDTPLLVLPEPFGQTAAFSREEISRYDERGVAWHWNNFTVGEHTGTHFDAPVHWVTGKDLADNCVDQVAVENFVAPAVVLDFSRECAENADFLLTSDHIRSWEDANGAIPPGSVQPFGSAETLRGRKGSNYEGGIRQPLIVSWPGHVKAGTRDDVTVGDGVDLMPTFAAAAGIAAPSSAEGINLLPAAEGHPITERPTLFWAFGRPGAQMLPRGPFDPHDQAPPLAVREGNWKLLANGDYSDVQLYDLDKNPTETTNLAPQKKAITKRLLAKLTEWRKHFHK